MVLGWGTPNSGTGHRHIASSPFRLFDSQPKGVSPFLDFFSFFEAVLSAFLPSESG